MMKELVRFHQIVGLDIKNVGVKHLERISFLLKRKGIPHAQFWPLVGTRHSSIIDMENENRDVGIELILRAYAQLGHTQLFRNEHGDAMPAISVVPYRDLTEGD